MTEELIGTDCSVKLYSKYVCLYLKIYAAFYFGRRSFLLQWVVVNVSASHISKDLGNFLRDGRKNVKSVQMVREAMNCTLLDTMWPCCMHQLMEAMFTYTRPTEDKAGENSIGMGGVSKMPV